MRWQGRSWKTLCILRASPPINVILFVAFFATVANFVRVSALYLLIILSPLEALSRITRWRTRPKEKSNTSGDAAPARKELKGDRVVCVRWRAIITIIDTDRLFRQLALNRNYRCAMAAISVRLAARSIVCKVNVPLRTCLTFEITLERLHSE